MEWDLETGKITKETLVDKTVDTIYKDIINKKIKPGEQIPTELQQSKRLGVARTTVREAYSYLIGKGLLIKEGKNVYIANKGSSILDSSVTSALISKLEIREFYEARKVLETKLGGLAAEKATEDNIENLKCINAKLLELPMDIAKIGEYDLEFHMAIAKAANNNILLSMYRPLMNIYIKYENYMHHILKSQSLYDTHKKIISAIEQKDSVKVEKLIIDSLNQSERIYHDNF